MRDSVVEIFEQQVDADPERDALRLAGSSLSATVSFGQLETQANAIAAELLRRRGWKAEPIPLAICAPELMLAAALGVLKAGKFYAAVNPLHPVRRVRRVLDELDAPLLLCDRRGASAATRGTPTLTVEEITAARPSGERPGLRFDGARFAYVLYTSGSTGAPRGVAQSRADMLHNVARHRPLSIGRDDCVTLLSADGFVAAVSNPYIALLGGAALAPRSFRDAGVAGIWDWLDAAGVTVLYAFPSFLRQLAASDTARGYRGLRLAYLGGETVLRADLAAARALFPAATLSVGLNSSETGLICLQLVAAHAALPDPVPVGRPVLDVEVAIVDARGRPLPAGAAGEIEVRSEYVQPRHWRRGLACPDGPPVVDERAGVGAESCNFGDGSAVVSPVADERAGVGAGYDDRRRLPRPNGTPAQAFRTGDRGRVGADGVVYHLGRIDGMVKIRGFRVETAEVEAVIAAIPGVAEVAVLGVGAQPSSVELAACVVARGTGVDPVSVRRAVARELPAAMVPTHVAVLDALPRTRNGKLDRRRLAQRLAGATARRGAVRAVATDAAPARRRIAELWRAELGLDDTTGDADFFALGGTSIAAVSLIARVRDAFGVPVPLTVLFETPTIDALATAVERLQRERAATESAAVRGDAVAFRPELIRELIALQAPLRDGPLAERRRQYELAEQTLGRHVTPGETVDAGGCPAEWVIPSRNPTQLVVVYLHGGGYSLGSPRSHRHLAAAIGRAAGAAVLAVDYRRAPECTFPAAVEDAVCAIRWLFARAGTRVALAGDSAGAGLAVASTIALRDTGAPLPCACVCFSPWVDLTCVADAYTRLATRDPLLDAADLRRMAAAYLGETDPRHPLASPVCADLKGLPPLLIQAGTDEILLDDARRLAGVARAAGVEVTLQEWPDMIHVWHWYWPILDDGREAIDSAGAFIRHNSLAAQSSDDYRRSGRARRPRTATTGAKVRSSATERTVPASSIQEAHLQIAASTSGRGYLSWVYQLNGRLDAAALALAVDDVVRRHAILRARFVRRNGRTDVVVAPFTPGTLAVIDVGGTTKRERLQAAIDDVEQLYGRLLPADDPYLRVTLYTIDRKTSVLAMFVAEALVDSDSGSLLAAALARAYAARAGRPTPAVGLPLVSSASYVDYLQSLHAPDRAAVARARAHWDRQARSAPALHGWPTRQTGDAGADGASCAFQLTAVEWARVERCARVLSTTPYVFVLTCLQTALARVAGMTHFLVHSIVSQRDDAAAGMIGNFHSLTRIDLRLDPHATFKGAVERTAAAVAEAIEHGVVPAPLTASGALATLPSGESLPQIRFYMFANHEGPVFAGIRRRRFRLHGVPCAPLTVNCIYGPQGRQDFVFSSTTASRELLESLATAMRAVVAQTPERRAGDPRRPPIGARM